MFYRIVLTMAVCFGLLFATTLEAQENWQITTVAGTGVAGFSGDGILATAAQLNYPGGLAIDAQGNIYIADALNARIRKIDLNGNITTVAGNGSGLGSFRGDDNWPATQAELGQPVDVAIDAQGNIYIADAWHHRIRKVNTNGIITTFAGKGVSSQEALFSGDNGLATQANLNDPRGIAIAPNGVVYIADTDNNRIRKIGLDGIITTFAGNGNATFAGDGGLATQASLRNPVGVAVDSQGNIYISSDSRVRKVNNSGIITTFVSLQTDSYPYAIRVDQQNNLYLTDAVYHNINRISPAGSLSVIVSRWSGGILPLTSPQGVIIDSQGKIYIADTNNHIIRRIEAVIPPPPPPTVSLSVSPTTIQRGQSAVLSWSSANATSIAIDGIGSVGLSGSTSVSPSSITTYTARVTGSGGTKEASVTLTVTEPVSGLPELLWHPNYKYLVWRQGTDNSDSVVFNEQSVGNSVFGIISLINSRVNVARATVVVDSITVNGDARVDFQTSDYVDEQGTAVSLPLRIDPERYYSFSVRFTPKSAGEKSAYLTVWHNGLNAPLTIHLAGKGLILPPPPAPTVSLSVSLDTIQRGQSATLSWSFSNATNVLIEPDIFDAGPTHPVRSCSVSPNSTTTYTARATGSGGTTTTSVTLVVAEPPPPPPPPPPPSPKLSFSEFSNKDFGEIIVGQKIALTAKIWNESDTALRVSSIRIGGQDVSDFTVVSAAPFNLSWTKQEFTVTFRPNSIGAKQAQVVIEHNGADSPFIIQITGQGIPAPIGAMTFDLDTALGDQKKTGLKGVSANQTIALQIYADAVKNLSGLFFTLEFDPETLTFQGFKEAFGFSPGVVEIQAGKVQLGSAIFGANTANVKNGFTLIGTVSLITSARFNSQSNTAVKITALTVASLEKPLGVDQPSEIFSSAIATLSGERNLLACDFNADGKVDFKDFLLFAQNFGKKGGDSVRFDLNGNGSVDFTDFVQFAAEFGKSQPSAKPLTISDLLAYLPEEYSLMQNYPNPFNSETTISYELPEAGRVKLAVYDLSGQEIKILADQAYQPAGQYRAIWDGQDDKGHPASSGLYLYRLEVAKQFSYTRKMVLSK